MKRLLRHALPYLGIWVAATGLGGCAHVRYYLFDRNKTYTEERPGTRDRVYLYRPLPPRPRPPVPKLWHMDIATFEGLTILAKEKAEARLAHEREALAQFMAKARAEEERAARLKKQYDAYAASPDAYKIAVPATGGVLNTEALYATIRQSYAVDSTKDSPKMAAFKHMKDTLDVALAQSGYSKEEIKQFYILQFLSAPQASATTGKPNSQRKPDNALTLPLAKLFLRPANQTENDLWAALPLAPRKP
jgi:hypothetical protein